MSELIASYKGLITYTESIDLQEKSHKEVSDGGSDRLLMMQYSHIITLGRRADKKDVLISRENMLDLGVEMFETDRGGEVTYHGPGQLVVYPIINLRRLNSMGPSEYVKKLKISISQFLSRYNIATEIYKKPTGVWVDESKIASIGIRISKGTSSHGFSLNVSTDLSYFKHIVACGLPQSTATSISEQTNFVVSVEETVRPIAQLISKTFDFDLRWEECPIYI
jgi:lipoate-protein ligase B